VQFVCNSCGHHHRGGRQWALWTLWKESSLSEEQDIAGLPTRGTSQPPSATPIRGFGKNFYNFIQHQVNALMELIDTFVSKTT
jgi:hypothetical protein